MKRMRRNSLRIPQTGWKVAVAALLAISGAQLAAQVADSSQLVPLPSAESVISRDTNPYSGSIPQGKATGDVIDLGVMDALDRGLKYNLGLFLSNQTTAEARADRLQSLSHLLPNINGSFAEQLYRLNLDAFGFKFPGFPQFCRSIRTHSHPGDRQLGAPQRVLD